jgi:hypothetical protein
MYWCVGGKEQERSTGQRREGERGATIARKKEWQW